MARKASIIVNSHSTFLPLFEQMRHDWVLYEHAGSPSVVNPSEHDVILLDKDLLTENSLDDWLSLGLPVLLANKAVKKKDLPAHVIELPEHIEPHVFKQLIKFSIERSLLIQEQQHLNGSVKLQDEGAAKLVEVGIALSAEPDLDKLLEKILTEGRKLAHCDAASLFLIDRSDHQKPTLKFKLTQNESIPDLAFQEQTIALTGSSIVGHTALTAEVLNIADAYDISPDLPYQFNSSFDQSMGYRTVSLIAIPMLDHQREIVGVLEFINRKKQSVTALKDHSEVEQQVIPFDEGQIDLLRALASQAAVAIENSKLLDDINRLFDGFVNASVFAIEQRDPCTSGHSFRVASLSELLAAQISQHGTGVLSQVRFSDDQLRELRFAALLHDFGKVGVREHVLTKAKKLSEDHLELLYYRIALAKQQIQNQYLSSMVSMFENEGEVDPATKHKMTMTMHKDIGLLDEYLKVIVKSNEPSVMPQERLENLDAIRSHLFNDCRGNLSSLITDAEYAALSIPRGSLNEEERREIELHVTHTVNFLSLIPWTSELAHIPGIAGAHHEKLNGSGYPNHLQSSEISYQSRIMTVCDIYDALTAADRPYKPAMPLEKALGVLESEAKGGLLDEQVVDVFIGAKIYARPIEKNINFEAISTQQGYAHHVCDFDLHKHS